MEINALGITATQKEQQRGRWGDAICFPPVLLLMQLKLDGATKRSLLGLGTKTTWSGLDTNTP